MRFQGKFSYDEIYIDTRRRVDIILTNIILCYSNPLKFEQIKKELTTSYNDLKNDPFQDLIILKVNFTIY